MSDVREAIPDVEAFYSDNNTYIAMSASGLRTTYDSGLVLSVSGSTGIVIAKPENVGGTGQSYCISAVDGGHWASVQGPGGQVVNNTTVASDPSPRTKRVGGNPERRRTREGAGNRALFVSPRPLGVMPARAEKRTLAA